MRTCIPHRKRYLIGLVTGLTLILLGLAFFLQNLGLMPLGVALRVWPAVLLVLAAGSFVRHGLLSTGGHLLVLAAVALQLKDLGHGPWLVQWWPVALVWLGVIKVLRSLWRRSRAGFQTSCQDAGERLS